MSTRCQEQFKSLFRGEWRATLLGLLASLGFILIQVNGALHLALADHCLTHELGAIAAEHGHEHANHGHDGSAHHAGRTHAELRTTHSSPPELGGSHCPFSLTDHPEQVGAKSPSTSPGSLLTGVRTEGFSLRHPRSAPDTGPQCSELAPASAGVQDSAPPRAPPSLV